MSKNTINHLRSLIQLSFVDGTFDDPEKSYVYAIGKGNGIPETEIDEMVKEVAKTSREAKEVSFEGLLSDERFEFLYNIIQLMKIDGNVYLSEIKYCQQIAEKLGYDKKVVKSMASRIYSDPSITANRDLIYKEAQKYFKY